LGQATRFTHRDILTNIRSADIAQSPTEITNAIADYERVVTILPCNTALNADLSLLLAARTDDAMLESDTAGADTALEQMQNQLGSLLACTPMNGKAWLDFAVINTYIEGLTPRSLGAYKMSAYVAPGESWLAEKRLIFALKFRPLLDTDARAVAVADLRVLEQAHPNRMNAVIKESQTASAPELYALFDAKAP
jgi:hypothetical protein